MSLGERIILLRKTRNMTQADLSKVLGVSRGAISMWELNLRIPDVEILVNLANDFKVSVDWLLGRSDELFDIDTLPEKAKDDIFRFIQYIRFQYENNNTHQAV